MTTWLQSFSRACTAALLGAAVLLTSLPALAAPASYKLGYGDALSVTFVGQPSLTVVDQPIRPDGRIALPFVKEVEVEGKTIGEVTAALNQAYRPYLAQPQVVVTVARFRPLKVTVLGQVRQPGTFDFQQAPGLLEALAAAGGLTERANRTDIKLVSPSGKITHYDLDALLHGKGLSARLEPGTVIEVQEVWIPDMYRALPIVASVVTAAALMFRNSW